MRRPDITMFKYHCLTMDDAVFEIVVVLLALFFIFLHIGGKWLKKYYDKNHGKNKE